MDAYTSIGSVIHHIEHLFGSVGNARYRSILNFHPRVVRPLSRSDSSIAVWKHTVGKVSAAARGSSLGLGKFEGLKLFVNSVRTPRYGVLCSSKLCLIDSLGLAAVLVVQRNHMQIDPAHSFLFLSLSLVFSVAAVEEAIRPEVANACQIEGEWRTTIAPLLTGPIEGIMHAYARMCLEGLVVLSQS